MDNNLQETLDFYQELIKSPKKLSNGYEIISEKLQNQENFCILTFSLFLESSVEAQIKHYIGNLIRYPLLEQWASSENLYEQKDNVREALLHAIIQNVGSSNLIETIGIIMADFIKLDDIYIWLDPLKELIGWMSTENSEITQTSLELFSNLFYYLDKTLNPLIQQIMPVLFQKFADPEINELQREQVLCLLYLIITSFSYADGANNQLVKMCFDETYELWMSLFISALNSSPKSHINIKKYILKILTVIFRDFSYYSRNSILKSLNPIWTFFNKILPLYGWNICYDIPVSALDDNTLFPPKDFNQNEFKKLNNQYNATAIRNDFHLRFLNQEEEYENEVESLVVQCVELVGTLVVKEQLYMAIKLAVFPLINALAHLMIMTRKEEKLWISDPNIQVQQSENEYNIKSLRNIVYKLIFELIEKFGDQATQAVMIVSEKFLLNLSEQQTVEMIENLFKKLNMGDLKQFKMLDFSKEKLMYYVKTSNFECEHPDHVWKRREVGLQLLGDFSDDIIYFTSKHQSSFEITNLIQNLTMEIDDENCIPILQSKALLTISKFSEIIAAKNKEIFLPLFQVSSKCLSKNRQLPVRMTAAKAITNIAHKLDKFQGQLNQNGEYSKYNIDNTDILLDLLDIMQYASEETLIIILDSLVALNKLSHKFQPIIAEVGKKDILQLFTLFHQENVVGRTVIELIKQLSQNKESFQNIFSVFQPFILDCIEIVNQQLQQNNDVSSLRPQDITLMGSIFEITGIFITNSVDTNSYEDLMQILQPLMNLMMINKEADLQINCTLCLKNFIKVAPHHIIKSNLVNDVLKVCEKLLEVPKESVYENNGQNCGNVIMLTFNNLLNGQANTEILKQVVLKVYRSRIPSIVQSLVLIYARMINNNSAETVKFLNTFEIETRPALKVLVDKWLLQMPVFRGKYTKNCAYQALIKLFLLKDKNLEQLLVLAFNPSHSTSSSPVQAPYKILSTLIRGLDNEMAHTRKDKNLTKNAQDQLRGSDYDDERMDTIEDDDDDYQDKFNELESNVKQVEVDLEILDNDDDDEEEEDQEEKQKEDQQNNKQEVQAQTNQVEGGNLGDFEKQSTFYLTEGLAFGQYDDEGEGDENLEDDLVYLKDPCIKYETSELLIKFFENLAKDDPKYFQNCLKHLLKEDIDKLQKYIKFKQSQ